MVDPSSWGRGDWTRMLRWILRSHEAIGKRASGERGLAECFHSIHEAPALWQRFEKGQPIRLREHARVQNNDQTLVAARADETAETLLELDDGLRQGVVHEGMAAGLGDGFAAGFDQRAVRR